MKLRISKIELKNFKAFKSIVVDSDHDFNIIIGENSVGKSSIFEAIQLWEKCYRTYILSSRKGFYKVKKSTNRYVNYQDVDFLRITKDEDLFHDSKDPDLGKCAEITITLANNEDREKTWSLGFKITCPTSIENAFYRVQPIEEIEFSGFADAFCGAGRFLDEAIFIYQTRPVAGVHQFEPYFNEGQIKKKIQKGSSHEVLRNKILSKRRSINDLEDSISEILERKVKFDLPPITRREKDEHIKLGVSVDDGKTYDLHLQGSGLLQIAEIISTIEFIDAPLKLLLVDEPDSHIHAKLQKNLISHLKKIDHNQFFVISHNDQFVTNAEKGEVFFLSEDSKSSGELKPIGPESFDIIRKSLGGVVVSLENLNRVQHIAFVEGNDDAEYLHILNERIKQITEPADCLSNVAFFPLRGKDNIVQKIEYNKRTLSSLLKGKTWNVIFDRDFSTNDIDQYLKEKIHGKRCRPHSHQGYCIESVVFSDIAILKRFFCSLVDVIPNEDVCRYVDEQIDQLRNDVTDVTSDINKELQVSFDGQKNNRPEFEGLQFVDVVRSWNEGGQFKPELVMSKRFIKRFVKSFEERIGVSLLLRNSDNDEEVSSRFLLNYFDFLNDIDDLVPSLRSLFTQLEILAEE